MRSPASHIAVAGGRMVAAAVAEVVEVGFGDVTAEDFGEVVFEIALAAASLIHMVCD